MHQPVVCCIEGCSSSPVAKEPSKENWKGLTLRTRGLPSVTLRFGSTVGNQKVYHQLQVVTAESSSYQDQLEVGENIQVSL